MRALTALALAVAALLACTPRATAAGTIDAQLAAQVARTKKLGPRPIDIIVELEGRPDVAVLERATAAKPESERPGAIAALLRQAFDRTAPKVKLALGKLGASEVEPLWIAHAFAAEVAPNAVEAVARTPGVARVYSDVALKSPSARTPTTKEAMQMRRSAELARRRTEAVNSPPAKPAPSMPEFNASEWRGTLATHLTALGVSEWWQRGVSGKGVVVAIVDSGVDGRDPALMPAFRSGARDWFDPFNQRTAPFDGGNHGSHVARLIAGVAQPGASEAPQGVAPNARWIAARIYDDAGTGKLSAIHRIHQWLLDPDGRPDTADAPRIVNNSWALPQTAGRCEREFERDFAVLRAARIHVLFAAGNEGPAENTSVSPSNNAGVIAVGALAADRKLASASSRGPSACGGGAYPHLLAPGTDVESRDVAARIVGTTDRVSGTSFAAALASGMLALVASEDASASFGEREKRLAAALAGGPIRAAAAPIELAWKPQRAADGSLVIDAVALREVLPWNARPAGMELEGAADSAVKLDGTGARVTAPLAEAVAPFSLIVRAEDGRRWRIAVAPQATVQAAAAAVRKLTMAVRGGGVATLARARLLQTLSLKPDSNVSIQASQSSRGARVAVLADGTVQYTARNGFRGVDQFVCTVTPASASAERVSVSVYVN